MFASFEFHKEYLSVCLMKKLELLLAAFPHSVSVHISNYR